MKRRIAIIIVVIFVILVIGVIMIGIMHNPWPFILVPAGMGIVIWANC